jgi:hypothetical protein
LLAILISFRQFRRGGILFRESSSEALPLHGSLRLDFADEQELEMVAVHYDR